MNNLSDKNFKRLKEYRKSVVSADKLNEMKHSNISTNNYREMPNYVARKDNGDHVDDINNKK